MALGIRGMITQGIIFVVPHDDQGTAFVYHCFYDFQGPGILWAAVDQVPQENGCPPRMTITSINILVSKFLQKALENPGVAVNVSDDIVMSGVSCHPPIIPYYRYYYKKKSKD